MLIYVQLTFTVPKSTPPGKYLLRTEYIAYHQEPEAQRFEFYLACTQLDISGSGGGEFQRMHWLSNTDNERHAWAIGEIPRSLRYV